MTTQNDNLQIWRSGEKTDPVFTKENKHGPGGSTSINTTYAFKRATEVFGPIGIGWGYEIIKDEIVDGAVKQWRTKDYETQVQEKIHNIQIRFWYKLNGERGEFDQFGHTDFVGINKWGPFTESEPQKKSLSDAIKKSLSMLGFMADIYLGMFDDQSYVQSVGADMAAERAEETINRDEEKANEFIAWIDERIKLLDTAQSAPTLSTMNTATMRTLEQRFSHGRITEKQRAFAARKFTDAYKKTMEKFKG